MINTQIRGEGGDIVARGRHGLVWSDALANIDPDRFPCLSGLLPYADAVFNERQVERLRREVCTDEAREVIGDDVAAEIVDLCVQVADHAHLYLWFLGD